jgi:hypothetical protein
VNLRRGLMNIKKQYRKEYELAKRNLANEPGALVWVKHEYQLFKYSENCVRLVFYPHKTKGTGNIHVRVRDEHSKDKQRADYLMKRLDDSAGNNCTFTRKHKVWDGNKN